MLQRLSDDGRYVGVVVLGLGVVDHFGKPVAPPSCWTKAPLRSPQLPAIVVAPPPHVEPAIPLKPAKGIARLHPTLVLPLFQRLATLLSVFICRCSVDVACYQRADVNPFKPALRKFQVRIFVDHSSGGGTDGAEVTATKGAATKYLGIEQERNRKQNGSQKCHGVRFQLRTFISV